MYLSKIHKKHLSKVSEQQSPGSLATGSKKSEPNKNMSKVSKVVSETVDGSQKSMSRIGQISRTMKIMSPHKMKKKKNKSMISSCSQ